MEKRLESNEEGIEKQVVICVYVLYLSNGMYYTGMTGNLDRRMKEHKNGESRSTKRFLPMELIFVARIEGRKKARLLEVRIKSRGAKQWLNEMRFNKLRYEYNITTQPTEWKTP